MRESFTELLTQKTVSVEPGVKRDTFAASGDGWAGDYTFRLNSTAMDRTSGDGPVELRFGWNDSSVMLGWRNVWFKTEYWRGVNDFIPAGTMEKTDARALRDRFNETYPELVAKLKRMSEGQFTISTKERT